MRVIAIAALAAIAFVPASANAFCGFYVGSADAKLFNKASQVIMVRDQNNGSWLVGCQFLQAISEDDLNGLLQGTTLVN